MMFKILKNMTVAETEHPTGTNFPMSILDNIIDDGRLIYHYTNKLYQIIKVEDFEIVYSSEQEMREVERKKK